MEYFVCPLCGKRTEINDDYLAFISTYNVLASFLGQKTVKNICDSCNYTVYEKQPEYIIRSIKGKDGEEKIHHPKYPVRINSIGYLNVCEVGSPAVFQYKNKDGSLLTSNVQSIVCDAKGNVKIVTTLNSQYTFEML